MFDRDPREPGNAEKATRLSPKFDRGPREDARFDCRAEAGRLIRNLKIQARGHPDSLLHAGSRVSAVKVRAGYISRAPSERTFTPGTLLSRFPRRRNYRATRLVI